MKPVIRPIQDEYFNLSFSNNSKKIVNEFEQNILRLREFLIKIDKENEQFFESVSNDDIPSEFSQISSLRQLKSLLNNYRVLTES
jgi:type III secretory pathway component EscR